MRKQSEMYQPMKIRIGTNRSGGHLLEVPEEELALVLLHGLRVEVDHHVLAYRIPSVREVVTHFI